MPQIIAQLHPPSSRLHDWLNPTAAGCGVGLLLAILSLSYSPLLLLGLIGAGLLFFYSFKRPELALLGLLICTSSIFTLGDVEKATRISIGIGRVSGPDILMITGLALILFRWKAQPNFSLARSPLNVPLLGFWGVSILSTLIALAQSNVEFNVALSEIRVVTNYLTFFWVTNLIRENRQLRILIEGLFLLTCLVAIEMIGYFVFDHSLLTGSSAGRIETLVTKGVGTYQGVKRVLIPGQSIVMVVFITLTILLFLKRPADLRIGRTLQWILVGMGVVLTFNRNFWVGISLATLLLGWIAREHRQKTFKWGIVLAVSIPVIFALGYSNARGYSSSIVVASFERVSSLFKSQTYTGAPTESTLRWRDVEYEYAFPKIASHPIVGIGLGTKYRPKDTRLDPKHKPGNRTYIHNGHVSVMLKSGLLGYFFFIWLSVAFLTRGLKYWRYIPDSHLRNVVFGLTLAYLGALIAAVTAPIMMSGYWTSVLGMMMGVSEVAIAKIPNNTEITKG